jgi:hypothetical protein
MKKTIYNILFNHETCIRFLMTVDTRCFREEFQQLSEHCIPSVNTLTTSVKCYPTLAFGDEYFNINKPNVEIRIKEIRIPTFN